MRGGCGWHAAGTLYGRGAAVPDRGAWSAPVRASRWSSGWIDGCGSAAGWTGSSQGCSRMIARQLAARPGWVTAASNARAAIPCAVLRDGMFGKAAITASSARADLASESSGVAAHGLSPEVRHAPAPRCLGGAIWGACPNACAQLDRTRTASSSLSCAHHRSSRFAPNRRRATASSSSGSPSTAARSCRANSLRCCAGSWFPRLAVCPASQAYQRLALVK